MNKNELSQSELIKKVFTRILVFIALMLVMFFVPAGTFSYWEAWVYLTVILVFMFSFLIYILKNDPELMERRMRTKEKETKQKLIVRLLFLCFLFTFLLPGFDKRFEWSHVPVEAVIFADIIVLLGYSMIFLAMRENSYASRIIEVEKGQKIISSGPYAIVRHPMYLGESLLLLLSPLALGSYWAIIPALFIIPILVARIRNEEQILERELKGYQEYMQKIKFRLIPGIW
jgi:protein-S-isoprenylcysteine O-methyltransferase Ste14